MFSLSRRPQCVHRTAQIALHPRLLTPLVPRQSMKKTARLPAQLRQNVDLPKDIVLPRLIIPLGSKQHNCMESFLSYAQRTNLDPSRTYYVGTHYEYMCALTLKRLGFHLHRTGRKADAGIDLLGHWVLPMLPEPIPIIVQCKSYVRTLSTGPKYIRELEGSLQSVPPSWRRKDVMAMLVTTQKATRGVLDQLGGTESPMGYMKITRGGTIEQMIWNRAACEKGLEGVNTTLRHTPLITLPEEDIPEQGGEGTGWHADTGKLVLRKKKKRAGTRKDVQLTYMGDPVFPDRVFVDEAKLKLMCEEAEMEIVNASKTEIDKRKAAAAKVEKAAKEKRAAKKAADKAKKLAAKKAVAARKTAARLAKKTATALPSRTATTHEQQDATTQVKRRPGRPKGSLNKKTLAKLAETP